MEQPGELLDRRLSVLKLIVGSLIAGILISMVIAVVMFPFFKGDVPGGRPVLISYVALGLTLLVLLVIRPLLLTSLTRSVITTTPPGEEEAVKYLYRTFQIIFLIDHFILEALGFLNLAGYICERQVWSFMVTTAIILVMVFRFPTRERAQRWTENFLNRLEAK